MIHELKKIFFRGLKWSLVLGCIAVVGLLFISGSVVSETKSRIVSLGALEDFDSDCVLVLGAGVWEGNVPSPMLKDRLDKSIEIAKAGIQKTLLMSGDHGTVNYDEVNVMKNYAISKGLSSSNIFMDHAGFSTYESLYRAKVVFGVKKLIIVSQKQHLYRALYIAQALGLDALGVAAEDIEYGGAFYREVRETLARVKDVFTTLIKPMPTYLGESISITGNGDVTNDK